MNISLTTLEDLGWLPHWDPEGHFPVKEGDLIKITPSEEIDLFWIATPKQESDGKWYGNAIYMYEPVPTLVGGVYSISDIRVDSTLFGGEDAPSLHGKVEEFAMWSRDIGQAGLQNYHLNLTGMIGGNAGDRYESIASAKNDELKYYHKFDTTSLLISNFSGEGAAAIKSSNFGTAGGKHKNSSIVEDGDYVKIEDMNFAEDFTLNFRFYMEEDEDFLLFNNPEALAVRYDANNRVFAIDFIPYIGDRKTYNFEISDMKVHSWYDLGIRYSAGRLAIVVNGVEGETFSPSLTIGGYKRTSLDCKNIDNITVFSGSGVGLNQGFDYYSYRAEISRFGSATGDAESERMAKDMHAGRFDSEIGGGANAMALIYDKENDVMAGMSINVGEEGSVKEFTDEVAGSISVEFGSQNGVNHSERAIVWKFSEMSSGLTFRTSVSQKIITSRPPHYHTNKNGSMIPNLIVPGMPIFMRVKIKDVISEQQDIFPKLSIFPGTRIKVIKKEMVPPLVDGLYAEYLASGKFELSRVDSYDSGLHAEEGVILTISSPTTKRSYGITTLGAYPAIGISTNGDIGYAYSRANSKPPLRTFPGPLKLKRLEGW